MKEARQRVWRTLATAAGSVVLAVSMVLTGGTALAAPQGQAVHKQKHKPSLHVGLKAKRHGHKVRLRVRLRGYAYEPLDREKGKPIHFPNPAGLDALMGTQVRWGDGTQGGSDAGAVRCGRPHVLRHIKDTYTLHKRYKKSGHYRIRYIQHGCGLPHKGVKKTTHVTIK